MAPLRAMRGASPGVNDAKADMACVAWALQERDYKGPDSNTKEGHLIVQPQVWESRYVRNGRGAPDDVAPALKAQAGQTGKGDAAPLVGVRRLTPLECERLQGFPDGWTDGQSDSGRYRQMGNAVAVPVARWIGRRIMEVGS